MSRMIMAGGAVLVSILALLAGCAGRQARREHQHDMAAVLQRLPGRYDNAAQVQAAGPGATSTALELRIVPFEDDIVGEYLMYVRVAAVTDARRVLSQQVWSFSQAKDGSVVQAVYLFADPGRWRQALDDPQLLESLTEQDLKQLRGCSLTWRRQGAGYEAATSAACRATGEQGAGLLVNADIALTDAGLSLTQRQFGADGRLDAGSEVEQFRRRPQQTQTPDL